MRDIHFSSRLVPMTQVQAPPDETESTRFPRLKADGSGGGERRDAVANRQRILGAARELFAERGVDNVNMRDVAVAAGVGQGTLYRHFEHKAALCEALAAGNVAEFTAAVLERLEAERTTRSVLELFRDFVDSMLTFIEENGDLVMAMGDSACGARPEAHYENPFPVWLRETMCVLLDLAIAGREIQPLDVEATVDLILSACESSQYLYKRRQRGYSRERIVDSITGLLRRS